jgi:hypothetical protein
MFSDPEKFSGRVFLELSFDGEDLTSLYGADGVLLRTE